MNEAYTECGPRILVYPLPPSYDSYGYNEAGDKFNHSFCIVDDFGDAVPVDPFQYQFEGYQSFLAPDYDPSTPVGQPYKYVMYYPIIH